ncbi:MAG: hypothetical protein IJ604_07330 [Prevotella sp.]|nr:hypothetical protein [Prevotella sp.]
MDKTIAKLKTLFYSLIIIALVLVVVYETDLILPGALSSDSKSSFVLSAIMELYTVCMIPLSLYLFRIPKIHQGLLSSPAKSLLCYGRLRMILLGVGLIANTLLYYLCMNVTFGYLAIIFLLVFPFVYPSKARCQAETSEEE